MTHDNSIEIEMPDSRLATWGSLGTVVRAKSVDQVLEQAGLDYTVNKHPIYTENPNSGQHMLVPGRFATVREEDGHVYDVVSDRYSIVQNREAFDFIDLIADDIHFERAGETASGMVWIIASMPEVSVLGDSFKPYVILRNGFAGNTKITAAICPLRIVCQNQFNFAFNNTQNAVKVLHVGDVAGKMADAREVLTLQADFMRSITEESERWAGIRLNDGQIQKVVEGMFPIHEDANPYAAHRAEDQRKRLINAYNHEDNANFHGTAWGMVNAYSDFVTHNEPTGQSATRFENRFMKTTFSPIDVEILERLEAVA